MSWIILGLKAGISIGLWGLFIFGDLSEEQI